MTRTYEIKVLIQYHNDAGLPWRVGGHGGIYGHQGTFWIHHHDGSVPVVRSWGEDSEKKKVS